MYRKILFAHDGSESRAAHALPHLVTLAQAFGAEVVLCHVLPTTGSVDPPDTMEQTLPSPSVASNVHLEQMKAELEAAGVEHVETLVLEGRPAESIVRAVEDLECDAVVVVTAGRGALGRFLVGSVADHVVRHAEAATLVIRDEGEGSRDR